MRLFNCFQSLHSLGCIRYLCAVAALFLFISFGPAIALDRQSSLEPLSFDAVAEQLVVDPYIFTHKKELLISIQQTRDFIKSDKGRTKLEAFGDEGINAEKLDRSLTHFATLLTNSASHDELVQRIRDSFDLFRSVGSDGRGSVFFTGYFRPVYQASHERTGPFRYPLFKKPSSFDVWSKPHPTRVALEGFDGTGKPGTILNGGELAWLQSRFEAFMIHVQGSAVLEFPDGSRRAIGFAGATEHPFRSIPKDYLKRQNVSWGNLPRFFQKHPGELDRLLSLNNRFIFFKEQESSSPIGSLGLPVIEERSIAIDQLKLPPGAVSIIRTTFPTADERGKLQMSVSSRFVLNLDSGSAIRGPGRVDVFMGTGEQARQRANHVHGGGELYYLFAKEEQTQP
jgi:membrane-bound lytic murein transglycosylase A